MKNPAPINGLISMRESALFPIAGIASSTSLGSRFDVFLVSIPFLILKATKDGVKRFDSVFSAIFGVFVELNLLDFVKNDPKSTAIVADAELFNTSGRKENIFYENLKWPNI